MKKVLALVLVLGLASLANAGLVYQVNGVDYTGGPINVAGPITISIYNSAQSAGAPDLGGVIVTGAATISASSVNASALPGSWSTSDYGLVSAGDSGLWADGYVVGISNDVPAVGNTAAGKLFDFTVAFTGPTAAFQAFDSSGAAIGQAVTLVPEPATMLLLGLGGLFFARKK